MSIFIKQIKMFILIEKYFWIKIKVIVTTYTIKAMDQPDHVTKFL